MNSGVLILTPVCLQAIFCCTRYVLGVLYAFQVRCTGTASDLLFGLPFCRHILRDLVSWICGGKSCFSRALSPLLVGLGLCLISCSAYPGCCGSTVSLWWPWCIFPICSAISFWFLLLFHCNMYLLEFYWVLPLCLFVQLLQLNCQLIHFLVFQHGP